MTKHIKTLCVAFIATLFGTSVEAADRLVPSTYATIQAALNAAASGDVVKIAPGTYNECVTLPNKGTLASRITVRSDDSVTNLPAAGVRFDPATHTGTVIIKAPNNACGVIETAVGARDYNIGPGLKIMPSTYRGGIELGINNSSQVLRADQPMNITVDRVWITGDVFNGAKVGIDMNGSNLVIQNSHIEHIKGNAQDAVGVRCFNGDGPITVYNNFINASGYGFICGGDQPNMMTTADASAATTTSATLTNLVNRQGGTMPISELRVGQSISVLSAGARYNPTIVSCGTSTLGATCTSANVTFTAIPTAPDIGAAGDIQWGSIPGQLNSGILIRRNYFWKDPAWMNNILSTVAVTSTSASTASGSLPAGTYYYRVQASYIGYQGSRHYSSASVETSRVLSATGQITINWNAVTGGPSSGLTYRVFRSTTAGVYAGYIDVGNVTSYVDTGVALTGTSSVSGGTKWLMKNAFEIKFGMNFQIDSNIFKHSPVGGEAGYGIWIKSNSYGNAYFMHHENTVFEKNVMDGMDGCFSILGRIDAPANTLTKPITNLTIRNNICFDSNQNWMMGKSDVFAIKIQSPVDGLVIDNNTFQHTMASFSYYDHTGTAGSIGTVNNFSFRNNIFRKGTYGVFGEGCAAHNATECFTEFVTGTSVMTGNVTGGSNMTRPAGNLLVPLTEYEGPDHFVNYQHTGGVIGDFALKPTSSWKGTADGGGDPGANIALITQATQGVTTGALEGSGGGVTPPSIPTASPLPSGTQNSAYTTTITTTDGTSPYTYAVISGTLPAGLSLGASGGSAGVLSGTPTNTGTFNFTVRSTDSTSGTALTASKAFALTIAPASATLAISTASPLPAREVSQSLTVQMQASGGTAPYVWSVNTGSTLPSGMTLSANGLLDGVPTADATYNFTLKVTDNVAATATKAFSWVVSKETMICNRTRSPKLGGVTVEGSFFRRPTAPTSASPDCAMKGDRWQNTATGERFIALETTPLVWAIDSTQRAVELENIGDPPTEGSMIVGTDDGSFRHVPRTSVTLPASAITEGTIDAARLPSVASATWQPTTVTMVGGAQVQTTNVAAGGSELILTTDPDAKYRAIVDTQGYTIVGWATTTTVACAGTPTEIRLEYWTGSAWATAGAPNQPCSPVGNKSAVFGTLVTGARAAGTIFRAFYVDGNGTSDPAVTSIYLLFRPY